MTDYYDGPRRGIAAFQGEPHLYVSRLGNIGNETEDSFLLMPIDADIFALAVEDWAIWRRWEDAYRAGTTPHETHPALPEDRERQLELASELERRLVMNEDAALCATAEFQAAGPSDHEATAGLLVKWTLVSRAAYVDRRSQYDFY